MRIKILKTLNHLNSKDSLVLHDNKRAKTRFSRSELKKKKNESILSLDPFSSRVLKRDRLFLKRFFCSFGLFLGLALGGCSQKVQLTNQTFVFELGKDVYANPDLYLNNPQDFEIGELSVEAKSPRVSLINNRFVSFNQDYLSVGEYDFVLRQGNREIPFLIKIKDTQPPTLQKSPASIEVLVGSEIDWQDVFEATDLSGVYYEGPTSLTSSVGEHEVDMRIRDRFGNTIVRHIRVNVKGG